MATVFTDFVSGTLTGAINNSVTTFSSSGLAALAAVGGSDVAKLVIDPFGINGLPEIVYVTGHTASSTTVTGVQRGMEGTAPRPHNAGMLWLHAPTATDFRELKQAIDGVVASPGTVLATAAPVDLVAGGGAQAGASVSLSRSDHRHALPAGTPLASSPGDTLSDGVATSVARSDHRHSREAYSGTVTNIGVSSAGAAQSISRGDHSHAIATGGITTYDQFATSLAPPVVCTSGTRPPHKASRRIFETDTNRVLVSDGTNWRRVASLGTVAAQTGVSVTSATSVPNNTLTRITNFAVAGTHDTDTFYQSGQYVKVPTGMAGLYLASIRAETNDGTVPPTLVGYVTLTNAPNGIGVNKKFSANNGTKSSMADGLFLISLVANQNIAVDVQHTAGFTKQINVALDLYPFILVP